MTPVNPVKISVHRIPAFDDNYLWLFHGSNSDQAYAVDPGDAAPILQALEDLNLSLAGIIITHHHGDHTGGIKTLLSHENVPVYGPVSDKIPQVTHPLTDGDILSLSPGMEFRVLEVPGHTLDHIAYFCDSTELAPILFCGDTLFSGGCGRLFEGSPIQMHHSLSRLAELPESTQLYCAHEYTLANLEFAIAVEPDNNDLQTYRNEVINARNNDQSTIPSTLEKEKLINPFLRSHTASLHQVAKQRTGQPPKNDAEVFAVIRTWKDSF